MNKKATFYIIIFSTGLCCCVSNAGRPEGKEKIFPVQMTDTINYNVEVLPILQAKCTPCHFTGGKMYDKMPFDNSLTILSHEAGVLKRIKDQSEAALIKQFIKQRIKGN
jgi:hypothetical protein